MSVDVVVIGGGPAGSAAAIAARRGGASVVVIGAEAAPGKCAVETLPPGARPLLRALGCWPSHEGSGVVSSFGNESAWGTSAIARTDFTCDPNGHGWHVDRQVLDASMRVTACQEGARFLEGIAVRISRPNDVWRVDVDRGETIDAKWIIDASGRRADVARSLGVARVVVDSLVAVVVSVQARHEVHDADRLTFTESAPDGWWLTTATDRRRIVAFFSDAAAAETRRAATAAGFLELWEATTRLRQRLPPDRYELLGVPQVSAAATSCLNSVGGDGWVAAGDAVATFDPVSSQGVLSAAYTGMRAGEAVLRARTGTHEWLDEYSQAVSTMFVRYLEQRMSCYRNEQRWADRSFWRTRHELPSMRPSSGPALENPIREAAESRVPKMGTL